MFIPDFERSAPVLTLGVWPDVKPKSYRHVPRSRPAGSYNGVSNRGLSSCGPTGGGPALLDKGEQGHDTGGEVMVDYRAEAIALVSLIEKRARVSLHSDQANIAADLIVKYAEALVDRSRATWEGLVHGRLPS